MAELQLRTCRLDRAGIPDLSDLVDITIDTAHIVSVTVMICSDEADLERPWYYPLAELHLARHPEPILVPLDSTTKLDEAEHSATLLRRALAQARS